MIQTRACDLTNVRTDLVALLAVQVSLPNYNICSDCGLSG